MENNIVQKENKNKMVKKLAVLNINKTLENNQYQLKNSRNEIKSKFRMNYAHMKK